MHIHLHILARTYKYLGEEGEQGGVELSIATRGPKISRAGAQNKAELSHSQMPVHDISVQQGHKRQSQQSQTEIEAVAWYRWLNGLTNPKLAFTKIPVSSIKEGIFNLSQDLCGDLFRSSIVPPHVCSLLKVFNPPFSHYPALFHTRTRFLVKLQVHYTITSLLSFYIISSTFSVCLPQSETIQQCKKSCNLQSFKSLEWTKFSLCVQAIFKEAHKQNITIAIPFQTFPNYPNSHISWNQSYTIEQLEKTK